jgi:hypothetical protein
VIDADPGRALADVRDSCARHESRRYASRGGNTRCHRSRVSGGRALPARVNAVAVDLAVEYVIAAQICDRPDRLPLAIELAAAA